MSGAEFLEAMLDSGARPFECQDCGVVHWLSEKDRLAIEAAAPDPVASPEAVPRSGCARRCEGRLGT